MIELNGISGQTIAANSFTIGEDNDIQFQGAGVTINGNNSGRLFTIDGANVGFADLNLINGRHQGSSGSGGSAGTFGGGGGSGGGGAGFGGAIFNNFNANLTIIDRR